MTVTEHRPTQNFKRLIWLSVWGLAGLAAGSCLIFLASRPLRQPAVEVQVVTGPNPLYVPPVGLGVDKPVKLSKAGGLEAVSVVVTRREGFKEPFVIWATTPRGSGLIAEPLDPIVKPEWDVAHLIIRGNDTLEPGWYKVELVGVGKEGKVSAPFAFTVEVTD
jgi:hypothetical protein